MASFSALLSVQGAVHCERASGPHGWQYSNSNQLDYCIQLLIVTMAKWGQICCISNQKVLVSNVSNSGWVRISLTHLACSSFEDFDIGFIEFHFIVYVDYNITFTFGCVSATFCPNHLISLGLSSSCLDWVPWIILNKNIVPPR